MHMQPNSNSQIYHLEKEDGMLLEEGPSRRRALSVNDITNSLRGRLPNPRVHLVATILGRFLFPILNK